ncbi:GTPase family protein [Nostoc sp. FACHB-110]|uniref:GTPase family protein n=1 Tax=Nostoc sp. FACHB-110 TaxID=2692834 RepID=UPI001687919B|nr:GTPase domain-containing protein [Nostoc sp. FACHB-110]MBD2437008.1 50S ribosome-binding GTPase [Nostoc sp. FACHB-110]
MADNNTSYSNEQLRDTFNKEYESFAKEIGQCNILLLGKTGVGKSTLLNAVFTKQLAITGIGKPITQDIQQYSQPNCPITVYDSPGLELTGRVIKRLKEDVARLISDQRKLPIQNHIHFVWFCIHEQLGRFEDAEEEWIKDLIKQEVPVIIVLTQTLDPKNSKLLDFIKEQNLPVDDVIPVLAKPVQITDYIEIPAHGLAHLVKVTASVLPEVARKAFIKEQKVNIDLKISEAEKYLNVYVAGAAVAGSPISWYFGGLAVAGAQTAMIAHLTAMCGLEFKSSFLVPIYAACASVSIPTLIAVSIPGIDSWLGVPAAAIMTYLMGKALLVGYEKYLKAQITGNEMSKSELAKIIIDSYKKSLRE